MPIKKISSIAISAMVSISPGYCHSNGNRETQAVRCLASWGAIPQEYRSPENKITISSAEDDKSFPGEKRFILAVYGNDKKIAIYDFKIEGDSSTSALNLQNNGILKIENTSVNFVEPPLGGVWAQEYMTKVARKALAQQRHVLRVEPLSVGNDCKAYFQEQR